MNLRISFIITIVFVFAVVGCGTAKPAMPVKVHWRNSLVGMGGVMQITNTSDKTISVDVLLKNDAEKQHRTFTAMIPAHSTNEYGWLEIDWLIVEGETFTLTSPYYQTKRGTFRP